MASTPPLLERFQGALIYDAVGDAPGWPGAVMTPQPLEQAAVALPLRRFIARKRRVGSGPLAYVEQALRQ